MLITCLMLTLCSGRGKEPDPDGPQWIVRSVREAQAHPWPQKRDQEEDQDDPLLTQPHLERVLHVVSGKQTCQSLTH